MNAITSPRNVRLLLLLLLVMVLPIQAQQPDPFVARPDPPGAVPKSGDAVEEKDADAAKKKQADELKKLNELLGKLEDDLIEQERLGVYGLDEILQYSTELRKEYRRHSESLQHGELQDDVRSGLERRQKLIRLYLWELKRVGPVLAGPEDKNSTSTQISKLMRDHRSLLQDPQLMGRVQGLLRRAYNVRNNRMRYRSGNRNFFFQDLNEEGAGVAQPNGPANPIAQAPKPPAANDVDDRLADPLRRLLKVGYREGRLVFDRSHWAKSFVGKSMTDIAKDVEMQLSQRGVKYPADKTNNLAFARVSERPHPVLLFENLQHEASRLGGGSSTSSGRGGNRWTKRFSNGGIEAKLVFEDDYFEFDMHSDARAIQQLRVSCPDLNSLKVIWLSDDRVFLFDQKAAGPVRLVDITDDEPVSWSAGSFGELYAQHPKAVEELLFPALEELNFALPPTRFHADVIERLILKIKEITPETTSKFEELLEQVGGKSFSTRDRATRELEQDLNEYLPLVLDAYRQDQLPLEVKTRLKLVLQRYENEWRELDTLVSVMGLASDADYLIQLLSIVDEKQQMLVLKQLQQETAQEFGTDIEAWKNWLAGQ